MKIDCTGCQDLDHALRLEWLEPNGQGGFASGTVAGANTRRYHALLLIARTPPGERVVLVNHLDEWVETQDVRAPLSTNLYPGAVYPAGYRSCVSFVLDPWPTWVYAIGDLLVQRELFVPHARNMVVLRWRRLDAVRRNAALDVRPMLSGRDSHAVHHENAVLRPDWQGTDGDISWQPYADIPAVRAQHNGTYDHRPDWYRRLQLPVEQERGLEPEEDWWSPGRLSFSLSLDAPATLVFSTERSGAVVVEQLASEERRRRTMPPRGSTEDDLTSRLWSATAAFLSTRGSGLTVVAGYPWFTDWGRDTFIALPGLCLVTGRYEAAWHIIESFLSTISGGLVPNRFPDDGQRPEYNTIDASLWFIYALDRYVAYSGDLRRLKTLAWPAVRGILSGYRDGTSFHIRRDNDGLITWHEPGAQLTWMDAKVGHRPVTPREGKPIEIQALWIRALAVGEHFAGKFGDPRLAAIYRRDRLQAVASFQQRFWYAPGGYLYDVIDGPDGDDSSLRPNQLYALALCEGLVRPEQARRAMQVIESQLLTPVGLRTLAPSDPRYHPRHQGNVAQRDEAYHQGTVWPFLLGVFITAWLRVHGRRPPQQARARRFLDGLAAHLEEQACLGQISEIFDAEAPHEPRGCFAQAWSVAEPLRALVEDLAIHTPVDGRRV
jgi:predicted glycogen debranching enzyme